MAMVWNKHKSTRCLWSTLVITTFVLCVVFAFISFSFGNNKYDAITRRSTDYSPTSEKLTEGICNSVCDTKACLQQSKLLLDRVLPSFNPCDDFYEFACGKFLESSYPDDVDTFGTLHTNQMRTKMKNILDNLEATPDSASEKLKIVYDSCMNLGSDSDALPALLQLLDNFGIQNWPNLTPEFKFGDFSLTKVIANLLIYEEYGFVKIAREYLSDNPANLSLEIGESSYEEKNDNLRNFQVDRILNYFKFIDCETVNKIMEESEAIYKAVKQVKLESKRIAEEDENSSAIVIDCSGEPERNWREICETLDFFINIADVSKEANKNYAAIDASDVYFMQNIFPLLRNFTDRSIANYLALNVLLNHLNELNFYFHLIDQKYGSFYDVYKGEIVPINRWEHCVDWISEFMTYEVAHEYTKKYLTVTMLQEVLNLTEEVIHETAEIFSRQKWISENITKDVTELIRNIDINLNYFIEIFSNETVINNRLKEFQPRDRSFLKNVMEFRRYATVGQIRGKRTIRFSRRARFMQNFLRSGAFGGGGGLSINLGLLQSPTYSPRLQRIFNVVALGMIVAHETGHNIFLSEGFRNLDKNEKDHFEAKKKCIEDQVSKFQFKLIGKNLNGSQYSNEDIADNVAVPLIEKMIEKYMSKEEEISLPALPYSTKQLLYISVAQTWCTALSKESEEISYEKGAHSPTNARINAIMQNSKGFSEAFGCPEGSFMNPADKCLILQ